MIDTQLTWYYIFWPRNRFGAVGIKKVAWIK